MDLTDCGGRAAGVAVGVEFVNADLCAQVNERQPAEGGQNNSTHSSQLIGQIRRHKSLTDFISGRSFWLAALVGRRSIEIHDYSFVSVVSNDHKTTKPTVSFFPFFFSFSSLL